MNETTTPLLSCVNCNRSEAAIPLVQWRLAGVTFWICPDCLPYLIHRRDEVMPRWNLPRTPAQG